MADLAYMVREDWAQEGTAMATQSAVIRDSLGEAPYLFFVRSAAKFLSDRPADLETVEFIAPDPTSRKIFSISELNALKFEDKVLNHSIAVVHPFEEQDLDSLAEAVANDRVVKVFVMIWSPTDVVRIWLDGLGAVDLHTRQTAPSPDPVMVEAAKSMVMEEHNGLSSGYGKDTVVQLVRAFTSAGYPLDVEAWLRAYFAAGGTFRNGDSLKRLLNEMKSGVKHRVKDRFRPNIVEILQERVASRESQEAD